MKFTTKHAEELISAFQLRQTLDDEEEVEMLQENNPFNLESIRALIDFAEGPEE